MKKIALLPIDNRPVTYTLLKDIIALNDNIELDIPERNYLGGLYEAANIKEITNWLIETASLLSSEGSLTGASSSFTSDSFAALSALTRSAV